MSDIGFIVGAAGLGLAVYTALRNRRLTARLRRAEQLFEHGTRVHATLKQDELLRSAEASAKELVQARRAEIRLEPDLMRDRDRSLVGNAGSLVALPIEARGRRLGVLQVEGDRDSAVFGEPERELLARFAGPLALAMDNAMLFEALEQSVGELQSATALKERLESELQIAGSIQLSFLPTTMPSANEPFDVCALLKSAKEVGGDFYNFFKIDDKHLFFTLGDVSDKGIPAALFMAMTLSLIKGKMGPGISPGELLEKVNDELCSDNAQLFATIVCGVLDIDSGEVVLSDGGHCTPYIAKADGSVQPIKLKKGIPLGSFPEFTYPDQTVLLEKGDRLVLYTDGITEAENALQEQYSTERLQAFLAQTKGYSSAEIIDALLMDVFMFADGAPQSDDIAVLCLMRR
ncbi:SpoIIE family protein phosphatase [Paenibacillus sp. PL2-23]|uniref:PP2C family protein-serine/threonine phosphatase n=1 Tax=Paenibacillus sp. PL2-23 TaxID=2100729 RepID=UPI0030F4E8A7